MNIHNLSMFSEGIKLKALLNYYLSLKIGLRMTRTGHRAYDNTADATLPRRVLLRPDLPLLPITTRSTFSFSAYLIIAFSTLRRDLRGFLRSYFVYVFRSFQII